MPKEKIVKDLLFRQSELQPPLEKYLGTQAGLPLWS